MVVKTTTTPTSVWKALVIPGSLVGITIFQLRDHLVSFSNFFFRDMNLGDQASLLILFFSLLFGTLSLAFVLIEDEDGPKSTPLLSPPSDKSTLDYPLEALSKANNDKDRFKLLYPMLRDELLDHMKNENEMGKEAVDWCREMMDYNVPGGKLNRGTTVLAVLRSLRSGELSTFDMARAAVLGWAIEFLQAFFLVADDVMDESKTRRGQPCWYKLPNVGWIAINDAFLLESYVFQILKTHFGHEPRIYAQLLELLLDVIAKTECGQLLDLTSQPKVEANPSGNNNNNNTPKIDINRFTLERYNLIVKYKTAFYSFYLPTAMGMILSDIRDPKAYDLATRICCRMGEYFQVQDDVLDCFGDPQVIGKIGTDIQDNKCSWLVVQALLRVNDKQRKVLEANYGQWNDAKVAKVKALYKELDLEKVFSEYEESSYAAIQQEVEAISHIMPKDVFEVLLKKIYKRSH